MNRRSRRLPELDVAKGLAMFLVVFGHILKFKSPVFNWIFSFHMPLFFFLTGMTFRPEKYKSLGQAVKNKLRTRLFPYFAITFAGFVICLIRPSYRIYMVMTGVKNELLSIFYYAQPAGLYVGQVWFLAVLFFAETGFYLWHRRFRDSSLLVRLSTLTAAALAGIEFLPWVNWLMWKYRPLGLSSVPWKLDTACVAFVFLAAGYYAGRADLLNRLQPLYWLLFPLLVWSNYLFGPQAGGYSNMCDGVYPPAPLYLTAAFTGILALSLTAVKWKRWRFWQFCGRHSMAIFAAQTFVNYLVAEGYQLLTGEWLEPMLSVDSEWMALGFACVSFGIMVGVLWVYEVLKKRLRRRIS